MPKLYVNKKHDTIYLQLDHFSSNTVSPINYNEDVEYVIDRVRSLHKSGFGFSHMNTLQEYLTARTEQDKKFKLKVEDFEVVSFKI
ncbi:hypothetical protein ETTORE_0319 [Pseudomonas phage Ettore]|nr:hypothetical protein ETTORE_0319 [Pseudomonas phage Ettore]